VAAKCVIKVLDWPPNPDNALKKVAKKHPDAIKVRSKKDMVKKILKWLKNNKKCDKIDQLIIMGHGSPGNISTGDGKTTKKCKHINGNKKDWSRDLKPLRGKFAKGALIKLFGCNTGVGKKGANKLADLARFFCTSVAGTTKKVSHKDEPCKSTPVVATPRTRPRIAKAKGGFKDLKKGKSKITFPTSKQILGMAIFESDENYWGRQPKTLQFFSGDEGLIQEIFDEMGPSDWYDGSELLMDYDAEGFLVLWNKKIMKFHLVLDWSALTLQIRDLVILIPINNYTSNLLRKVAVTIPDRPIRIPRRDIILRRIRRGRRRFRSGVVVDVRG